MIESSAKKRDGGKGRWYVRGPVLGLLFTAAFLYLFAFLLSREVMPASLIGDGAIFSVFLGSAVGGMAAAKIRREGVLVAGALTGTIMLAVIVLVVVLRPDGTVFSGETLRTAIGAVSGGTFGGVLCLRRTSGKKHKIKMARRKR